MLRRQATDELIDVLTDQLAQIIRRGAVWKRTEGGWASEFMPVEKLKAEFGSRLPPNLSLRVFGKVIHEVRARGKSKDIYSKVKSALDKLSREELEQLFHVVTLEVPDANP